MPGGLLHHSLAARASRSLVARGGIARTFGSLAGFLVVSFLCWGIYILADAFANPIGAGAAAVISAAFIIAVGTILLFYLVKPQVKARTHEHTADSPASRPTRQDNFRNDLPYQRFYVDHSRIRQ